MKSLLQLAIAVLLVTGGSGTGNGLTNVDNSSNAHSLLSLRDKTGNGFNYSGEGVRPLNAFGDKTGNGFDEGGHGVKPINTSLAGGRVGNGFTGGHTGNGLLNEGSAGVRGGLVAFTGDKTGNGLSEGGVSGHAIASNGGGVRG